MQIFAFDENEKKISPLIAKRKKDYQCPACQAPLRVRSGNLRRPHFYHLNPSLCHYKEKSSLHLSVQLFLEKKLQDCSLEKSFPSLKRIADCVWESKRILFEIQCSPITQEEVYARICDYTSLGYKIVWILHEKSFNKKHLSRAEKFLKRFPHYYTNVDNEGKGIIYERENRVEIDLTRPLFPPHPIFKGKKPWNIAFTPLEKPTKRRKRPLNHFFQKIAALLLHNS